MMKTPQRCVAIVCEGRPAVLDDLAGIVATLTGDRVESYELPPTIAPDPSAVVAGLARLHPGRLAIVAVLLPGFPPEGR
jgi:hypothetical protein